ncbi:hypothetical protein M23134_06800 [Microscilla marina ATCC 23134]|uniref:Uncharacterized protein n=1 Tax=Microscilla marina ATCC 23134 TaxID=313606 RepID=A1ZWS2_MICM2|nr:hypothetical protein M23134_06800 [Microscilla marina ATCC 23134]
MILLKLYKFPQSTCTYKFVCSVDGYDATSDVSLYGFWFDFQGFFGTSSPSFLLGDSPNQPSKYSVHCYEL